MTKNAPLTVEKINQVIKYGAEQGVIHLVTDSTPLNGRSIQLDGNQLLNFSSCSYLGLEVDPRLKKAGKAAIDKYGMLFASSRAFVAIDLYDELEDKLEQLFGQPTLVAPTTTLGHQANIPTLVTPRDAVIIDHQVHASVQSAVKIVQANGTHVEMIRHNNMDMLESRLQKLCKEYRRVWYMADGIYSMFGDAAPLNRIVELLDQYEQFHFYVDDAHGMSWKGKNGSGFVLSEIPYHPKMILITTLAKTFGSLGSALVFPDNKTKQLVKNCGKTLMFSGPIAPPSLAGNIASAEIHLTPEIYDKQRALKSRMEYTVKVANALDLPLVGKSLTPVFFVGVGTPNVCFNMAKRMIKNGYLLSPAVYPSVPYSNAGLRFTVTTHLGFDDIRNMLTCIAEQLEEALLEEKYAKEKIFKAFTKHGFFEKKMKQLEDLKIVRSLAS